MNDDELGTRLEEAFRTHAKDMYRGVGLAAEARKRVRRRRTALTTAAAVVLMIGLGSAWGSATGFRIGGNDASTAGAGGDGKSVPEAPGSARDDGAEKDTAWRWESYGGLQVQVPASWGYGVTDFPWCSQEDTRAAKTDGEVGRPGPYGYVRCNDPAPLSALRQHVWLSPAQGAQPSSMQLGDGWVRDVFIAGKVKVEVLTHADQDLRLRIKDSIRLVGTDAYGCPSTHPAAVPTFTRPADGLEWSAPGVTGVSICRYRIGYDGSPLFASASRNAAGAALLLDTIRAAPAEGGPDDVKGDPAKLGSDLTVLRFSTADGIREVYVRYSGARHNGFDNGTQVRRLTKPALSFLTGPLTVRSAPSVTAPLLPLG